MSDSISLNLSSSLPYNYNGYSEVYAKLQKAKDEQGFLGSAWNGFKEFTGLGQSYSDCESMLEKYQNGEVTMEEAIEYIDDYKNKQDNMVELGKNIITGTAAIAMTGLTCGFGATALLTAETAKIVAIGAGIGAITKTGVGMLDRAVNDVEDDVLDKTEVIKDLTSGAITGATSAIPSSSFEKLKNITPTEEVVAVALKQQPSSLLSKTLCCTTCGALSGSTSYITDVVLDEEKDFNFGDFTDAILTSALVSGSVGTVFGKFQNTSSGSKYTKYLKDLDNENEIVLNVTNSNLRKVFGRNVKDVGNVLTNV